MHVRMGFFKFPLLLLFSSSLCINIALLAFFFGLGVPFYLLLFFFWEVTFLFFFLIFFSFDFLRLVWFLFLFFIFFKIRRDFYFLINLCHYTFLCGYLSHFYFYFNWVLFFNNGMWVNLFKLIFFLIFSFLIKQKKEKINIYPIFSLFHPFTIFYHFIFLDWPKIWDRNFIFPAYASIKYWLI